MKKKNHNWTVAGILFLAACAQQPSSVSPSPTASAPSPSVPAASASVAYVRNKSPEGARAFIIQPADGATVSNPVTVKFGLEGMDVVPAGTAQEHSGHHHLLIDQAALPPLNESIPANDKVIHFGMGQTETTVTLTPGEHTLQILLGDANHVPHDPPVASETIKITVE